MIKVLNDDQTEHPNHTNDDIITDNLTNTKEAQFTNPSSFTNKDSSVPNNVSSHIPTETPNVTLSLTTLAPKEKWSRDKHIELVNIVGNPRAGMLTRKMGKNLSAASVGKCLFADFLSEDEPRKVSEVYKHPGWVDYMQEELNKFSRNKVWILVPPPYGGNTGGYDQITTKDAMILYCLANGAGKSVNEGKKPGSKNRRRNSIHKHNKHSLSKLEAPIFGPLSKEASEAQKGQSKNRKKSITTKDNIPSQPLASIPMVAKIHKEAMQATSCQTSLGDTREVQADPQLSNVVSTSLTEPVYLASTLVHSKSASGRNTLAAFTTKVDPNQSNHKDSLPQQQDKTKSAEDGLYGMYSPEDDQLIQVSSEEDANIKTETKDTSVPKPSPPSTRTVWIQELTNQLPSKFEEVNGTLVYLKQYVKKLEINVRADLKGILNKLADLQTSISALTIRVKSMKRFTWTFHLT
uniref:Uncharacterized protein n=1 Tax=Tanacetum cinerariifolium TaxID=118510 RepID=A0A6L2KG13_TANCI|nr:hypothetical protein [Tanacetum cinerariifolium]